MSRHIMYRYKIHGLQTVLGTYRSANTDVFYETYDEALSAAEACIAKGTCDGIVIFKAVHVVRPRKAPTQIGDISETGEVHWHAVRETP